MFFLFFGVIKHFSLSFTVFSNIWKNHLNTCVFNVKTVKEREKCLKRLIKLFSHLPFSLIEDSFKPLPQAPHLKGSEPVWFKLALSVNKSFLNVLLVNQIIHDLPFASFPLVERNRADGPILFSISSSSAIIKKFFFK